MRSRGKLFVVSGPSGGGKTTVVNALLKRMPSAYRSVSVTTRQRRPSERDRAHYRFVSAEQFQRLRRQGALVEWARVHRAHYGTPKAPVLRALAHGRDVVLSIDVQGARQIRRQFGERAALVFIAPPSFDHLRRRLLKRRTETPEAVQRRLQAASREVDCAKWYDYVIVNYRRATAVEQLKAIVIAERLRVDSRGAENKISNL